MMGEVLGNHDQVITILIGMLPDVLADHLISKYTPGSTEFEDLIIVLQDHLMKIDQKRTAKKVIKKVAKRGIGED